MPEERLALNTRHRQAVANAKARGEHDLLLAFERATRDSKAVISRSVNEVYRLSTSDREIYATYYQQIDAGVRMPKGEKWDVLRAVVDEALFSNYKTHIRFAALSINDRGLSNYGSCHVVLRDDMISHRATVFEENSVLFMSRHKVLMGEAYDLPRGVRANWRKRHILCVSKKEPLLRTGLKTEDFASLLLKNGSSSDADDFIEVHVWGPMTVHTFEKVVIQMGTNIKRAERARLSALKDSLLKANVAFVEVKM